MGQAIEVGGERVADITATKGPKGSKGSKGSKGPKVKAQSD